MVRATKREEEVFAGARVISPREQPPQLSRLPSSASRRRRRRSRRCRTARRCNVHFYGRPNQAAAPRRLLSRREEPFFAIFFSSFLFFFHLSNIPGPGIKIFVEMRR